LLLTAVTSAGKTISGIRMNEDTFTIQLKTAGGAIYSFRKRDLKELKKETGQSPMPAFAKVLSGNEIQDLAAFLVASGNQSSGTPASENKDPENKP